jgi:hypothetical protein
MLDYTTTINGVRYARLVLETRAYACISMLHDMLVVNGIKTVPAELFDYLSPVALAY